jgi:hypothetical protein
VVFQFSTCFLLHTRYHSSKWYTNSQIINHHSTKCGFPILNMRQHVAFCIPGSLVKVPIQIHTILAITQLSVVFWQLSDIPDMWVTFIHSHGPLIYSHNSSIFIYQRLSSISILKNRFTCSGSLSLPSTIEISLFFSRSIHTPYFQDGKFEPSNLAMWPTSVAVLFAILIYNQCK